MKIPYLIWLRARGDGKVMNKLFPVSSQAFGFCSASGCKPGEAKEPKDQGSRINNSWPKALYSFFNIKDTNVVNKENKTVVSPSGLNCLSWVPGLRNPNARPSQRISKPGMTPRVRFMEGEAE